MFALHVVLKDFVRHIEFHHRRKNQRSVTSDEESYGFESGSIPKDTFFLGLKEIEYKLFGNDDKNAEGAAERILIGEDADDVSQLLKEETTCASTGSTKSIKGPNSLDHLKKNKREAPMYGKESSSCQPIAPRPLDKPTEFP